MKDTQKFTLTIGQLRELVAEATGNEEIDEGVWDTVKGWFGAGKKPAETPAPAAPASAAQGAEPTATPQQKGAFQKMLTNFLNWMVNIGKVNEKKVLAAMPKDDRKDPEAVAQAMKEAQSFSIGKLVAALSAIVGSETTNEATATIQQEQKACTQEGAMAEKQLQQQGQQQAAESLLEDDENPWGSWEPSNDELARQIFDNYEGYAGIPKSTVYDYLLTGSRERQEEMAQAFQNLSDLLYEWGIEKSRHLDVFSSIDQMFVDNKPEGVDEGLWDRFRAKTAGWAGVAKGLGHNVRSWASGDADGKNRTVAKQSVWGRGQSDKFATLINQYIKKVNSLKGILSNVINKIWKDNPEHQEQGNEMMAKMDAFVQQAQAALKQTQDELKASNYDRKAQGQQQQGQGDDKQGFKGDDKGEKNSQGDDKKQNSEKPEDKKSNEKPAGDKEEGKKDDEKKGDGEKKVDENTKLRLTLGQIRKLVKEASLNDIPDLHEYVVVFDEDDSLEFQEADRNNAFAQVAMRVSDTGMYPLEFTEDGIDILDEFDRWCDSDMVDEGLGNFLKSVGGAIGTAAKQGVKNAIATTTGAAAEIGDAFKNRNKPIEPADFANKLARIIGELEMDLKDMGWSVKQNPGLGKVIQDVEKSANEIHGKGEKGVVTNLDKIRHGIGKLMGAAIMGAVTGVALGAVTKPLRAFMSPRAHAALVAAATVLLRALMRNIQNMDLTIDKREEAKANEALQKVAAEQPQAAQPAPAAAQPAAAPTEPAPAAAPAAPAAPAEEPAPQPAPAPAPAQAPEQATAPTPAPAASQTPPPPAPTPAPAEPVTPVAPAQPATPVAPAASPAPQAAAPAAQPATAQEPATADAQAALRAKRSAAAKKGAQTKAANKAKADALHAKRSAAAKKGAQTRANRLKAAQDAEAKKQAELKAKRSAAAKKGAQTRAANKAAATKRKPINRKKVKEDSKFCLTIGQLRKLIQEATNG